jgi:hypothetical protein
LDIWDRKRRLDEAALAVQSNGLAWHGGDGEACPHCHVLVPGGFLLTLVDADVTGCLRCLEAPAFIGLVGNGRLPDELVSAAGRQDAMRQIATEFRQHIKAARRGQEVRPKARSNWWQREGDADATDTQLHNGWPTSAKSAERQKKPNPQPRAKPARERSPIRPHIRQVTRAGRAPTPLEILGLSGMPTIEEINAAFRRRALTRHPDHGGSDEAFRKLVAARDSLLAGKW